MKSFLVCSLLFFSISCGGPSSEHRMALTAAIRFPIEEFAVASERTVWIVTDRGELVRIVDHQADVVEFPGKPQTVFFLNENEGWIFAADKNLWSTNDGGQNWILKSSLTDVGPTITELIFIDRQSGWLVAWFGVFTTSDGGTTWNMVYPNDELNYEKLSAQPTNISVVSKEIAWVAMTNGIVISTNDGGRTWRRYKPVPGDRDVRAIHANEKGEVWAGVVGGKQSGLYYSSTSGQEWQQVLEDGAAGKLCGISTSFGAQKDGWVFGSGCAKHPYDPDPIEGFAFTTRNGHDWTRMHGETFRIPFDEVKFTDPSNGWLLGYNHQERRSYVYRTADGGENWNLVYEISRPRERVQ